MSSPKRHVFISLLFILKSGKCGTISFEDSFDNSFDNSSTTTAGEDNVCDAFFKAVSSKFLSAGSFLLQGDVQIQGNTKGTTPSLNSFLQARDFLISPSLSCWEHIFVCSVTLKCFPSSLLIACSSRSKI